MSDTALLYLIFLVLCFIAGLLIGMR